MIRALLIIVRFHDGRYHGSGDWPPSPARLFQALVAGAAGKSLGDEVQTALAWLETLESPIVAVPNAVLGQSFTHYMPNNDLDAVGGDVRRIGEVRSAIKQYRPRLFDAAVPLLYAWMFESSETYERHAATIANIADYLYQLGRGVDMAWAVGEVLDADAVEVRLAEYPGAIHRPTPGGRGAELDCPCGGSLASLFERHRQSGQRFTSAEVAGKARVQFSQPPRPRFRSVAYDSPSTYLLFDLRDTAKPSTPFAPWPLERAAELVLKLRGAIGDNGIPTSGAARKLWDALPARRGEICRVLIGREATDADKSRRVRILPLPSIGHPQASRAIRRVLVEVPPNCPLSAADVAWVFSGLEVRPEVVDEDTGEVTVSARLINAEEWSMLDHYGVKNGEGARAWRSVTPLALPNSAKQRRRESRNGSERTAEVEVATAAVLQAMRHAGVCINADAVRVQREPFEAKGVKAEAFAPGTRFHQGRLWHVEIIFPRPMDGPLVLGDGRYLGLGLMAPVRERVRAWQLKVETIPRGASIEGIARALRRAVMARYARANGRFMPEWVSGHASDGSPTRDDNHLAFVVDEPRQRLLVLLPNASQSPQSQPARREAAFLQAAMEGFDLLRAGEAGVLRLRSTAGIQQDDPLIKASRNWRSLTPYRVTRHKELGDPTAALIADVTEECLRRGFPKPVVEVIRFESERGRGLCGEFRLEFAHAVEGPVLLGKDRYLGGGVLVGVEEPVG